MLTWKTPLLEFPRFYPHFPADENEDKNGVQLYSTVTKHPGLISPTLIKVPIRIDYLLAPSYLLFYFIRFHFPLLLVSIFHGVWISRKWCFSMQTWISCHIEVGVNQTSIKYRRLHTVVAPLQAAVDYWPSLPPRLQAKIHYICQFYVIIWRLKIHFFSV